MRLDPLARTTTIAITMDVVKPQQIVQHVWPMDVVTRLEIQDVGQIVRSASLHVIGAPTDLAAQLTMVRVLLEAQADVVTLVT